MLWFVKFIFCFWIGHCFSFWFSVLELGLSSWFFLLFDLDFPLDDCFRFWMLVWISGFLVLDLDFGFGFWIWILDLDFGLDFDWIFIWFLINGRRVWIMPGKGWVALPERGKLTHSGRRVWTMLGKGPEWPGFGLGLRPYIINCYFQVVEYGLCSARVRRDQDSA